MHHTHSWTHHTIPAAICLSALTTWTKNCALGRKDSDIKHSFVVSEASMLAQLLQLELERFTSRFQVLASGPSSSAFNPAPWERTASWERTGDGLVLGSPPRMWVTSRVSCCWLCPGPALGIRKVNQQIQGLFLIFTFQIIFFKINIYLLCLGWQEIHMLYLT